MRNPLRNKRVLITCGPTWVAVDAMRVLSNQSSGQLGQLLAKECAKANAKVTVLQGPVVDKLSVKGITVKPFTFFDELQKMLKAELNRNYDVVIHAAAVSDYKPKKAKKTKLSSDLSRLRLNLVPTKKLIHKIKRLQPKTFLVGFKLEPKITPRSAGLEARSLFKKANCDLVLANSLNGHKYQGYIFKKDGSCVAKAASRSMIARKLIKSIKESI